MSRRSTLKFTLLSAVALMVTLATSPRVQGADAAADLLKQLPAEAQVVVVAPSLRDASDSVAMLSQQLMLPVPAMANLLDTLKAQAGVAQGLDDAGSFAWVISHIPGPAAPGAPQVVMLLPISDYAAFLQNFGAVPADGVIPIQMPDGSPGFVRLLGKHVVISPNQQDTLNYQPDAKASWLSLADDAGKNLINDSQVTVLLNMPALAPVVRAMFDQMRAIMPQATAMQGQGPDMEVQLALITLYFQAYEAALRDLNFLAIGMDIKPQGVGMTALAHIKPDSTLSQLIKPTRGDTSDLNLLPGEDAILAVSLDMQMFDWARITDHLREAVPADSPAHDMVQMFISQISATENIQHMATGLYPPTFNDQGEVQPRMVALIKSAASDEYVKNLAAALTNMNGQPLPGMAEPIKTSYTPNAAKFGQLQADLFVTEQKLSNMNQTPAMIQALTKSFGGEGSRGYIINTDKTQTVTVVGTDEPWVTRVLDVVTQANGYGKSPAVGELRKYLLDKPAMEAYLDLGNVTRLINQLSPQPLLPEQMIPVDLPPIGFAATVKDTTVTKRMFIPMQTIAYVKNLGMMMMMRMMQPQPQPRQPQPAPQPQLQ